MVLTQEGIEEAARLKAAGNVKMQEGLFNAAQALYTQAIALDPSVIGYYTNRAACWLKLEKFGAAMCARRRARAPRFRLLT